MTTVVNTSNTEVTTPTSYVSRWIAQSHHVYQKKINEFYSPSSPTPSSSSSSDFRTAFNQTPPISISTIKTNSLKPHTTTWQAQARSRLNPVNTTIDDSSQLTSINYNNSELQEKLFCVRALLDAKKQRLCRHFSSSSTSSSAIADQVPFPTVLRIQSSPRASQAPLPPPPPPPPPSSSTSLLALENAYLSHDENPSATVYAYHSSSILPCLMEESPSDSGLSDATKTTHNDDIIDSAIKNPAIIDLSKPLSKEEMLAIIQILRELWKKTFGSEMPNIPMKTSLSTATVPSKRRTGETSYLSNNNKSQYHSTPALNKLSAELSDIKDKLKRFSTGRSIDEQTKSTTVEMKPSESEFIPINGDSLVFIPLGPPLTTEDLERMQAKREALIRRQIQRREEQLIRKNNRLIAAIDRQNEYRLYEEYTAQRRQEDDRRRKAILHAHIEQKRLERDPPSSHDYYFAAARNRNRLKRKASMTSFVSFDDERSFGGSTFDLFSSTSGKKSIQTSKRNASRFDFLSPSLTASTTASRSKMNRAASTCNINEHYNSFTSLNSKATIPMSNRPTRSAALFGGSLMNISMINTKKNRQHSMNLLEDPFDLTIESPMSSSHSSLISCTQRSSHLTRSQTHLSTKSNKQTILNALKRVVLAGPANERQRDLVSRDIETSEARHFIILFRDHRLQFRAVYMYIPETDIIEKLHGIGPNIITEIMVEKWFKYNSGCKRFNNIPIRHFSIQCDAIIIHNDFWQKKLLMHMNKLH